MLLTLAFPLLLLGGMAIAAQSSINGTLSVRTDVVTTAWLTNLVASVILLGLVMFFEPPQAETMFSVPSWQVRCLVTFRWWRSWLQCRVLVQRQPLWASSLDK